MVIIFSRCCAFSSSRQTTDIYPQHNDPQNNDTQHDDSQRNGNQHNDTQHNNI